MKQAVGTIVLGIASFLYVRYLARQAKMYDGRTKRFGEILSVLLVLLGTGYLVRELVNAIG